MERLRTHGSVEAGSQWQETVLVRDFATAMAVNRRRQPRVAYRLLCDAGYYGHRCALSCNARHDKFGHYFCSGNGTRVCLDGWKGSFCDARKYISLPVPYVWFKRRDSTHDSIRFEGVVSTIR